MLFDLGWPFALADVTRTVSTSIFPTQYFSHPGNNDAVVLLVTGVASSSSMLSPSTIVSALPISTMAQSAHSPSPNDFLVDNTTSRSEAVSLRSIVLNSTNYYRSLYVADDVVWNASLTDFAALWAQRCTWEHSGGPYGENLASGYASVALAIDAWGDEVAQYDWAEPGFSESTGHFTQLVWRSTTSVGCSMVLCNNATKVGVQGQYLVCEYSPRGNIESEYDTNVRRPGELIM